MADNPPISTEVPETVTVDTGADKAQLGDLNAEFADFWKEKDSETTTAPEAPGEERTGAAQETKETKPETKPAAQETKPPVTETKPAPVETKPAAKELTDDEVQRMELPPNARPELVEEFRKVKDLWKNDRARVKAETERAAKLQTELEEARKNSWTPEARADYEHASQIRRRFD